MISTNQDMYKQNVRFSKADGLGKVVRVLDCAEINCRLDAARYGSQARKNLMCT